MKKTSPLEKGALILSLCSLFLLMRRKKKKGKAPKYREGNGQLYMNKLRLSIADFNTLKSAGGSKLVLQFFYPGTEKCQSPTLYAYAMHAQNKSTDKPPVQLQYDNVTEEPFTGRPQVLGDQQIKIETLDSLLLQGMGNKAAKDLYFSFTPKFQKDNPHIYYDVRLSGRDGDFDETAITNPSPPKSAF